jgi:hypothetical protein
MENRHHYKYVVIDSSKENHNSVDAKFKVQIPQGITGTTRVCVKSFSMPNSYHNIYGDLKTAKFVEFYRPTSGGDWVYEVFSFNLGEGYTETDNLVIKSSTNWRVRRLGFPSSLPLGSRRRDGCIAIVERVFT